MASRAEGRIGEAPALAAAPASPPRVGAAFRAAFTDYYFNSMRLVPANVVWGVGLIGIVLVGIVWPLGGLLLLPLLALPTAGTFRLAAAIVRVAPHPGWHDVVWPYRHAAASTIAIGAGLVAATVILATNLLTGIVGGGGPPSWVIATLAGWGLIAIWSAALVGWPLVMDPARDRQPLPDKLRLAVAILLIHPVRVGGLAVTIGITTAISTVLTAALLTISIAFIALVACRVVFPVADRIEPLVSGEHL